MTIAHLLYLPKIENAYRVLYVGNNSHIRIVLRSNPAVCVRTVLRVNYI